jgi:DNA-binding beta-propeller fold protein YncE
VYAGDPIGDRLVAEIQIARPGTVDAPWTVGVGADAVWVANRGGGNGSVMKVDPETNAVVGTVDLPDKQRGGPIVGAAGVYVSTKSRVLRIDPQTLATTTLVDEGAETIGVAGDDVWVTIAGEAIRLDGTTGEELDRVQLGAADILSEIGFTGGSVWIGADEAVWRVDAETAEVVAEIPVGNVPHEVEADGAVWTAGPGTDDATEEGCSAVHRIDPGTNEVVASLLVGPHGSSSMATLDGQVWSRPAPHLLLRIDPATNRVVEAIEGLPAADEPSWMAGGFGSLWVADWGGKLLRIDP